MKTLFLIFLVLVAVLPNIALAETVLREGEAISINEDQTIKGDFCGNAGLVNPINFSGKVEGDAYLFGRTVTNNGSVQGDLSVLSGISQVHASVTDDVRIVAGSVTLADYVGGDVFVVGGTLEVLSTAEIAGDLFFYGGSAEVNGKVGGSIFGKFNSLRIDSPVKGSVDVISSGSIVIGSRADTGGDVTYDSRSELVRAQDAVVVGEISKQKKVAETNSLQILLVAFLAYTFMVFVVYLILKNKLDGLIAINEKTFTKFGLLGLAGFLILPMLVSLLFVSGIGVLVALIVLFGALALTLLSLAIAPIMLGKLINEKVFKTRGVSLLSTLIAIAVIEIVFMVPIIGRAIGIAILAVVFGALLNRIYHSLV